MPQIFQLENIGAISYKFVAALIAFDNIQKAPISSL
jgi:hypothetical protein